MFKAWIEHRPGGLDVARIEDAIREAEKRTSAEIRVSIAPWFWGDIHKVARRAFGRLGVTRTRLRNGVLFFLVPARRQLVILGDVGVHAKVGHAFWERLVTTTVSQ